RKLYDLDELYTVVEAWRASGLKVALTNGCFDLLHAGHVRLLQDSSAQSDRLIVAINSDASVRRLKGEDRPLMPEAQRVEVLSALECVDAVVIYGEDTPLQVIERICPDFLIKGGDYTVQTVVGADVVQAYGGKILLVPLVKDISTSRLAHIISRL
ncbi:D-glycero-beta-D-manno-heptose 1-phosphate adenylyltransferase, partial [bacterium]